MVEINLPNAITIGLIAVIALMAVRTVAKMANKNAPV